MRLAKKNKETFKGYLSARELKPYANSAGDTSVCFLRTQKNGPTRIIA